MFKRYQLDRLIKGIERLILRLLIVGLILLVVVQFILTNSNLEKALVSKIPWAQEMLKLGQQAEFNAPAKKVFSQADEEYIEVCLQNNLSSSQVKLLKNDRVVGDFSQQKYIKVKIENGDKIALDARGCKQGLWIEISDLSTSLTNLTVGQQVWIKDEYKVLGIIKGINKF